MYTKTILADPQRPFIWEYFRPGTIPLPGERAFYDEVCPFRWRAGEQLTKLCVTRNEGDHSSQSLCSVHSPFILPPTGSNRQSPPLILVKNSAQSAPWPLPLQL